MRLVVKLLLLAALALAVQTLIDLSLLFPSDSARIDHEGASSDSAAVAAQTECRLRSCNAATRWVVKKAVEPVAGEEQP